MEARLRRLWLVPALLLALLPVAGAASRPSHSSKSSQCATCPRDSHGKIKRSKRARDDFRKAQPCPGGRDQGSTHRCSGYVVDHVKPLECGGADAPSNMQWQTVAEGKAKDKTERNCR
jgi:hypothetical protein